MYFYKMSNSNILADSCIKKYLKKANDNIEQMKENFANAVFSAMASVLIGIEMWDRLDNFNIILRVLIVLVALLVSYFIITVAVIKLTAVIEWMCRIKGEKKDNETADDIKERFNTEIMTMYADEVITSILEYIDDNEMLKAVYLHQVVWSNNSEQNLTFQYKLLRRTVRGSEPGAPCARLMDNINAVKWEEKNVFL